MQYHKNSFRNPKFKQNQNIACTRSLVMPQLSKNNVLQVIDPMFLGIYLAKYSQIFGFPSQQVEQSNFHIFFQRHSQSSLGMKKVFWHQVSSVVCILFKTETNIIFKTLPGLLQYDFKNFSVLLANNFKFNIASFSAVKTNRYNVAYNRTEILQYTIQYTQPLLKERQYLVLKQPLESS